MEPQRRPEYRCERYCLGFQRPAVTYDWEARPDLPFRAEGLLIWGATDQTMITNCQVGNVRHLLASAAPIPAKFFEAGLSFNDFAALMVDESGKTLPPPVSYPNAMNRPGEFFQRFLRSHPEVKPHQLMDFRVIHLGIVFRLTILGPIQALALWGWCSIAD
jgi:hypothetical protein